MYPTLINPILILLLLAILHKSLHVVWALYYYTFTETWSDLVYPNGCRFDMAPPYHFSPVSYV